MKNGVNEIGRLWGMGYMNPERTVFVSVDETTAVGPFPRSISPLTGDDYATESP